MNPKLFDSNLGVRFQATKKYKGNYKESWPRACWGAANAWLMICGPSPGKADDKANKWSGGLNRPRDKDTAGIGLDVVSFNFNSNKGRNIGWLKLAKAVLGNEQAARSLTCVANLDWGHNPDQCKIKQEFLELGCDTIFSLMRKSKPRVVVVLVNRTWEVLSLFIKKYEIEFKTPPPYLTREPIIFKIPGNDVPSILLKSPHHPSRGGLFTDEHRKRIQKTVEWFLGAAK